MLETPGTLFQGPRLAVERRVHVLACLAEGVGMRATARGCAVDPHTVLGWLVAAAEPLNALSRSVLGEVHVRPGHLDAWSAGRRAVQDGERSQDEAIQRLARSPQWGWAASDPESNLLLALDGGHRTRAMAQRCVQQVVQVVAPGWVPLWLPDGFKEAPTALLTPDGQGVQPARWRAPGPTPPPRWRPRPPRL